MIKHSSRPGQTNNNERQYLTSPIANLKSFLFTLLFVWISLSAAAQTSASAYVERHKDEAVEEMNEHGIPASIILAVAMHESANGNSKIARYLNNHFGMKGKNSSKKIRSSYKGYNSVEDSYTDFITMLKSRNKFSPLFDKLNHYDYTNWARGIKKGGYAVSKTWVSQIVGIIKKHRLYEYDNRPASLTNNATLSGSTALAVYKVKKGDTLLHIARKHGTTVKKIQAKNSLKSSRLKIGQKLKI